MELLKIWKRSLYKKVVDDPANEELWNRMLATLQLVEEEGKLPDNAWLLTVLSHIDGKECEIFKSDYKYVKPIGANQKSDIVFDNFDNLWDKLPDLDDK